MKVTIWIRAQVFENYATDQQGNYDQKNPKWKKKSGQDFIFEAASDDLMDYPGIIEFCKQVCRMESDFKYRYEYVAHDVKYSKPVDVTNIYKAWRQRREQKPGAELIQH